MLNYKIVPKRNYVELWIEGKFMGNCDNEAEARYELKKACEEGGKEIPSATVPKESHKKPKLG